MKRILLLTLLLIGLVSSRTTAQIASYTKQGTVKVGSGLAITGGTLSVTATGSQSGASFTTVSSYASLTALATPSVMTTVKVDYDNSRNLLNAIYQLWPDGGRYYVTTGTDRPVTDFSQTGSVIDDGGGSFNGDATYSSSKVFDGNLNTFYNTATAGSTTNYVGRDLGSAKTVNRLNVYARQEAMYATRINNALVQYSTNGTSWTTVSTVSGVTMMNYTQPVTFSFAPVSARYWRVYGAVEGNIAEFQILSIN